MFYCKIKNNNLSELLLNNKNYTLNYIIDLLKNFDCSINEIILKLNKINKNENN